MIWSTVEWKEEAEGRGDGEEFLSAGEEGKDETEEARELQAERGTKGDGELDLDPPSRLFCLNRFGTPPLLSDLPLSFRSELELMLSPPMPPLPSPQIPDGFLLSPSLGVGG